MRGLLKLVASLFRPTRPEEVADGCDEEYARRRNQAIDEDADFVRAVNITKQSILATKVVWAGTSAARRKGLLGRDSMSGDEGMYIVPTQWIHMFGMRFPIDVAFLAADGRVLHIHHALKPNRLSRPVWRAEGALELAAGILANSNTEVGDIIQFE